MPSSLSVARKEGEGGGAENDVLTLRRVPLPVSGKALAINPKSALCKFHRAKIYFNIGRHAEALKELEQLRQIVPKESLVYYLIGKVGS